jgi:uroporphyrinogen decarboxylase
MTHRERFLATLERQPTDRPAIWLGMPTDEALPALLRHFGAADRHDLICRLGDDIWPVELPYHSPEADAIYAALDFAGHGPETNDARTLTVPGFFAGQVDPVALDDFPWPDPAAHIDPVACTAAVAEAPDGMAVLGVIWSAHFQDACAAFGMENALTTMFDAPDMFRAIIDRITDFYLAANEIFYRETAGRLDAVLIGNDFGSQTGLMVSPALLREFVFPGTRCLVEQAHEAGLKVIHHSCGAIREIIPDLIELGTDAIHPIQVLASGMDAASLHRDFGNEVAFCGGVDVQELLVHGQPDEVERAVSELVARFPTGLIVSPSHEALLPDVPPRNVEAMYRAVGAWEGRT